MDYLTPLHVILSVGPTGPQSKDLPGSLWLQGRIGKILRLAEPVLSKVEVLAQDDNKGEAEGILSRSCKVSGS